MAKVSCMNKSKELVRCFNLDCHDASPTCGTHAQSEDLLHGGQGCRDRVVIYLTKSRKEQSLKNKAD